MGADPGINPTLGPTATKWREKHIKNEANMEGQQGIGLAMTRGQTDLERIEVALAGTVPAGHRQDRVSPCLSYSDPNRTVARLGPAPPEGAVHQCPEPSGFNGETSDPSVMRRGQGWRLTPEDTHCQIIRHGAFHAVPPP